MGKSKIELKSGYFVGEKFFDHRRDAEEYELQEEIVNCLIEHGLMEDSSRKAAKVLAERYQIKEKYDYILDNEVEPIYEIPGE